MGLLVPSTVGSSFEAWLIILRELSNNSNLNNIFVLQKITVKYILKRKPSDS